MSAKYRRALAFLLCVAFPIAACTDDRSVGRWEGAISNLRYIWTAAPGIDVLTGPSVPIRAFVESFMLSQHAGDMAYAYPGFERAVPDTDSNLWVTTPALDVPSKDEAVGNILHHIASVERIDDSLEAVVCRYTYRVASETENGSYQSVARAGLKDDRGIHVIKIALTGSSPPIPPQAGPRPDPVDDVFGDWRVRGMLDSFSSDEAGFDEAWPTYEADDRTCVENAPDPAPVRAAIIDGTHPRSEFPTAPASPGWPEPQ